MIQGGGNSVFLFGEEGAAAEVGVFSVGFEELFVGSLFDDVAFFENVNAMCVLDGGEAVGDDEGGAVLHEVVEGGLDLAFGFRIDGGGRFVQE